MISRENIKRNIFFIAILSNGFSFLLLDKVMKQSSPENNILSEITKDTIMKNGTASFEVFEAIDQLGQDLLWLRSQADL